jgi:hypothetical protein
LSCRICKRSVKEGVYCSNHGEAYENLEQGFEKWRYALGYTWVEYLDKVGKVSGTGRWVKEIIQDILQASD